MSQLVERNASLLHFLCTCKNKKQRNAFVELLNDDQLNAIAECNHNVIKGTVPLSSVIQLETEASTSPGLGRRSRHCAFTRNRKKKSQASKTKSHSTERWYSTRTSCPFTRSGYQSFDKIRGRRYTAFG